MNEFTDMVDGIWFKIIEKQMKTILFFVSTIIHPVKE